MSEEEIIKNLKELISWKGKNVEIRDYEIDAIQSLLNLYSKEKEKNKELEEKLKISVAIITKGMYPEQNEGDNDFDKQFISKDKIKNKYLEMEKEYSRKVYDNNYNRTEVKKEEMYKRQVYEELLEEKENV